MALHPMFAAAKKWCEANPRWTRICDIDDTSTMYLTWPELPEMDRRAWTNDYGDSAEAMWDEYATYCPCWHRYGFVSEYGEFHDDILDVRRGTNSVMVFEVHGPRGIYRFGGRGARSSRAKSSGLREAKTQQAE